jgi:hypothetical protein
MFCSIQQDAALTLLVWAGLAGTRLLVELVPWYRAYEAVVGIRNPEILHAAAVASFNPKCLVKFSKITYTDDWLA